jgi:hypothetical protein
LWLAAAAHSRSGKPEEKSDDEHGSKFKAENKSLHLLQRRGCSWGGDGLGHGKPGGCGDGGALGGFLGYHLTDRIGGGTKSD